MLNIQELKSFNNSCNEFVNGKYLLAEIKISSILNNLSENEKLNNIVNGCLQEYNFNEEFKNHTFSKDDYSVLSLPSSDNELIAFVYNLLYKFKSNEFDFNKFLNQYFGTETSKEFYEFANKVIIPFQNAVNTVYSKRHILVETDDYQNNIYNKIMSAIKLILKNLDSYKLNMNQKEEFTMLLNSLYFASEKNDKKLVYSLMIGLDYFTKSNKKSRIAYLTLEECFEN